MSVLYKWETVIQRLLATCTSDRGGIYSNRNDPLPSQSSASNHPFIFPHCYHIPKTQYVPFSLINSQLKDTSPFQKEETLTSFVRLPVIGKSGIVLFMGSKC